MRREYEGENLIINSYLTDYYPNLNEETRRKIIARIDDLIDENRDYLDEENYIHIANIFASISFYENLTKEKTKEEAYQIVSQTIWNKAEELSIKYKRLAKLPGSLLVLSKTITKDIKTNSGNGWLYDFQDKTNDNNSFKFTCNSCLYAKLFDKYDLKELGPIFCRIDIINYSSLKGIEFIRNHTLCVDGEPCDFLFTKDNKKE